jgi:hypothetical protein
MFAIDCTLLTFIQRAADRTLYLYAEKFFYRHNSLKIGSRHNSLRIGSFMHISKKSVV